ncbi:inositol monophosphatase family protein [Candidatus Microthrix parvicella]|uniref:inositol monophosphatase family protein n=1 Tax=Candidatus Neomicrothrix parvicella TaxID=41950 RepID=UPI00035EA257|nr:inositol monophosphatase family protein [Candidatus Microthrix parvicella]
MSTTPPADPELLAAARRFAQEAGALTLDWFRGSDLNLEHKGDGTPVTAADKASEARLRLLIGDFAPDDTILGEEEGLSTGSSGRRWIIDPIDGTKAFTRGVPLYSTLVAVEDEHGPAVGVIELPALGQRVFAGRGLGCFVADARGERPARVSATDTVGSAMLTTSGFGSWSTEQVVAVHGCGALLRTWGDGYGYAMVATGVADAMVDPIVAEWDVAPMSIILTEAGGRFTALDGTEGADRGSGLGTNGLIHDYLMAVLPH